MIEAKTVHTRREIDEDRTDDHAVLNVDAKVWGSCG